MLPFAQCKDRWVLQPNSISSDKIILDASWSIFLAQNTPLYIETPDGRFEAHFDAENPAFVFTKKVTLQPCELLELVKEDPLVFRLVYDSKKRSQRVTPADDGVLPALEDLEILKKSPSSWESFRLAQQASQFLTIPGFENLISIPFLKEVDLYDHQLKTVKTVLNRFRGRALLCDEVGLGKTIEAGLVCLELYLRKLCRSILILTPPSLTAQWKGEMQRKFGLDFIASFDPSFLETDNPWQKFDLIVASYHTAKRVPHRAAIEARHWDLIIVDEAHHLRNRSTLLWKFIGALKKKYILLLTATPIQNGLEDLYNLITLLKPGLLSTTSSFKKRFMDAKDPLKAKNIGELQGLVDETIIRNRRSSLGIRFTRRFAKTLRINPSQEEALLYQEFTKFAKENLQKGSDREISGMGILSLQRILGSTPKAFSKVVETSEKKAFSSFAMAAKNLPPCGKILAFVEWVKSLTDRAVVFTQFRTTQEILLEALEKEGIKTAVFHGGLSRLEKEKAISLFREEKQILLSTDSGSEGRNLQFCNILGNFDLPWNPMRIEQRIGRLSRIGQQRDVYVINFVTAGTIEEEILHLLEAKINLFELVMGEMDMILGQMDDDRDFEEQILDLWQKASTSEEFHDKMEHFGSELVDAKKSYLTGQAYDEEFFGSKFMATE